MSGGIGSSNGRKSAAALLMAGVFSRALKASMARCGPSAGYWPYALPFGATARAINSVE